MPAKRAAAVFVGSLGLSPGAWADTSGEPGPLIRDRRLGASLDLALGGEATETYGGSHSLGPGFGVTPWFTWCDAGMGFCYGPSLSLRSLSWESGSTFSVAPALRGALELGADKETGLGFQFVLDLGYRVGLGSATLAGFYAALDFDGRWWLNRDLGIVFGLGLSYMPAVPLTEVPVLHAGLEHSFF